MRFALVFLLAAAAMGEPLARSVSPSRQFLIFGGDTRLRGVVSDLAEQMKQQTMSILRESDGWKTPVLINLQTPEANAPDVQSKSLRFSQTGAGLKLQLDLVMSGDVRAREIRREILRAILLERMYRKHTDIAPGAAYVQPPDWLLEGLLAKIESPTWPPLPPPTSLEEFLRQRPNDLDEPARELHRAGAFALVNVVVDLTQGHGGFGRYLDHLAEDSNDSLGDLRAQFPELSANDLDRLWQTRLSRLSSQNADLPRFAEAEEQIAQALQIRLGGKSLTLADFVKPKLSAAEKATLEITAENLMLLGARTHPVMRPIVNEYQKIAQLLATGKRQGAAARLTNLEDTRRRLVRRMDAIDDYLNWFEATQMTAASGVFEDYLRSSRREKNPDRRDAMSIYLDAIEQQTQK